jgi:2-keto-4-pentenoate hydratase/2-oxohepta-3-ene-1,7-dioic acid hydratase in catechol pathway
MRLVTFAFGTGTRPGALTEGDDKIVDLVAAQLAADGKIEFDSIQSLIEDGANALHRANEVSKHATGDAVLQRVAVKLLAPVPIPASIRDGLCYEKHLKQVGAAARKLTGKGQPPPGDNAPKLGPDAFFYDYPLFYKGNRFSVVGPDADVVWPAYCKWFDYELELGCFIGKPGRDIAKDKAHEHIFGYTIFNDFSARDSHFAEMGAMQGPTVGKDFDSGNAIGPCLVTADEINAHDLDMIVRVNGEERARGNSGDAYWSFEDLIAKASKGCTLYSGEFFGGGTMGSGSGIELMRLLADGDVVELEVENIGILRNRVVKQQA